MRRIRSVCVHSGLSHIHAYSVSVRICRHRASETGSEWFSVPRTRPKVQRNQAPPRDRHTMCGITGFIDLKRASAAERLRDDVRRMADALVHRGPDMGDQWVDPEIGLALGFRRLAIIDLTPTGHQPMTSADGRFVVVYNGEAYNFVDLRAELEAAGHTFRGTSDTEVFLEGCVAWGVEATVGRLNGMFAFALWDRREKRLWLGRDRIGIKPLYYGEIDNLFLFGSELKALRAKDGWQPEIDRDALTAYFRFNYIPAPHTIYRNIYKLEPGTLLSLRLGEKPKLERYWDLASTASQDRLPSR